MAMHTTATNALIVMGCALLLGGCAGPAGLGGPSVTGYVPASLMSPNGYSATRIDATRYKVGATGTAATPGPRLESIATARAAEIGVEDKQRYFKVSGVAHGVQCTDKQEGYKGPASVATRHPTVTLDIVYSNAATPPDATYQPSVETFQRLQAELAAPPAATVGVADADKDLLARCSGRA